MKVFALIFMLFATTAYAMKEDLGFVPVPFDVLPLINIPRSTFLYTVGDWYLTKYGHGDDTYRAEYVEVLPTQENVRQDFKIVGWYRPNESSTIIIYAGTNNSGLNLLGQVDVSVIEEETDPRILAQKYGWN